MTPRPASLPLFAVLAMLIACQPSSPDRPSPQAAASPAPAASPDDPPPPPARRIVSFIPAMTEIAFDLGLGPRLVGVSTFDVHPPEVASLEKVGGVLDPNLEKTLALQPDLILSTPSIKGIEALARDRNIPIVLTRTDSLQDVFTAYADLGRAANVPDRARDRIAALKAHLDRARAAHQGPRPKVLLVVGRDQNALSGLYGAGPGSFLDELLTIAGGDNVLPPSVGKWPQLSLEGLLQYPPDLIIEFAPDGVDSPDELQQSRETWRSLPALQAARDGRVHRLTGNHLLLPGPRLTLTVDALQRALASTPPADPPHTP